MPAKDVYHEAVKNALIKEGWTILADPYTIEYEEDNLYAIIFNNKKEEITSWIKSSNIES